MMNTFMLSILAAEKPFFKGECASLTVPTGDGEYGIWAGHSNMTAAVVPGVLKLRLPNGREIAAAVSEGIVKTENGEVLLLADTAELPEEIDENRARRAAEAAKEEMLQRRSVREYSAAQAKMARAISRINARKYVK